MTIALPPPPLPRILVAWSRLDPLLCTSPPPPSTGPTAPLPDVGRPEGTRLGPGDCTPGTVLGGPR